MDIITNCDTLKGQLRDTLRILKEEKAKENNGTIASFIEKYEKALSLLENKDKGIHKYLITLLGNARGFLETTSKWDQEFLHEMGKTESLIRQLLNKHDDSNIGSE